MKRFEFRLERVLKLKEQRKRLAELAQKQAFLALEGARAESAAVRDLLAQNALALQVQLGQCVPSGTWIAHYLHSARLGQALDAAEAKVEHFTQGLQEANKKRAQVAVEVEVLLSLRHEQRQKHGEETQWAEQIRLDDLGIQRWRAARRTDWQSVLPPEHAAEPSRAEGETP